MRLLLAGPLVSPIPNENYRFTVASRSGDRPHICDLESCFPLVECTCRDWVCRRYPAFKKSGIAEPCVHGRHALQFFALLCVQATAPSLKPQES